MFALPETAKGPIPQEIERRFQPADSGLSFEGHRCSYCGQAIIGISRVDWIRGVWEHFGESPGCYRIAKPIWEAYLAGKL